MPLSVGGVALARRQRPKAFWMIAGALALVAFGVSFAFPWLQLTEGGEQGFGGSGLETRAFAIGVIAVACCAQLALIPRIPKGLSAVLAVLLALIAWVFATMTRFWIS